MHRLSHRLPHQRGRPHHTVEPGRRHHLDDGAHPAALLTDPAGPRTVELDLARRVGTVPQLVLEPLDQEHVARPVGQHARYEEAGQPAGRLRQYEKAVAHRRRTEPLVTGEQILPVGVQRARARRVGAYVAAALLLRHAHPEEHTGLLGGGPQPRLVPMGGQPGLPLGRELRIRTQRRNRGMGHRHRTAVPGLRLSPHQEPGRTAQMAPGPAPGIGQPGGDGLPQQLMPGRMEVDLVDPVPVPVMGAQLRRILIGQRTPLLCLGRPGDVAERRQFRTGLVQKSGRAVPFHALRESPVGAEDVVPHQGRNLVGHCVGARCHADTVRRCRQ